MDPQTRSDIELQSKEARADLKKWETDWAQSHDGAKPGRDDIKGNPEIARKYKQYNKLHDILAGKVPPPSNSTTTSPTPAPRPRKRKSAGPSTSSASNAATTPSKRRRPSATPSKTPSNRPSSDPLLAALSPSLSRSLFSPPAASSIGPTPQRDGHALGLFDLLVPLTPGRGGDDTSSRGRFGNFMVKSLFATPSKKSAVKDVESKAGGAGEDEEDEEETPRPRRGKTPMSASKRQLLDTFMTPLKKRAGAADKPAGAQITPRSVSRLQFDTPSFLRRAPPPPPPPAGTGAEEGGGLDGLPPLRLPRKPLVRGLSAIVASLRKVEEEALDEELEALREMEADEMGSRVLNARPRPSKVAGAGKENKTTGDEATGRRRLSGMAGKENFETSAVVEGDKDGGSVAGAETDAGAQQKVDMCAGILAPDAQTRLLGGFDDEAMYDSPPEERLGRDGQPLRVYRKKNPKRTTRRSNMKPVPARRPTAPVCEEVEEEAEEAEKAEKAEKAEAVVETFGARQAVEGNGGAEGDEGNGTDGGGAYGEGSDAESGSGPSGDEHGNEEKKKQKKKKAKTKRTNIKGKGAGRGKAAAAGKGADGGGKDAETEPKKTRKVNGNALVHTNFRRLKLKNHGAKGGPGFGSRFRRRR